MTSSINGKLKESGTILKTILAVFFFFAMASVVSAYPLQVNLDNHNYVQGEEMLVEGEITDTEEQVNVSVEIYNSSGTLMDSFTPTTSGSTPNSFAISNEIDVNYSTGEYNVYVTSGTNSLNTSFQVISERLKPKLHLLSHKSDFVAVNTSLNATSSPSGYNFTDIINKSKSSPGKVHYGNVTLNNSTQYYFVVVDSSSQGIYDTIYVDDDKNFELNNFSEDELVSEYMVEQEYGAGDTFKDYMIGQIDIREGNSVFLGSPVNSTTFSEGDIIDFVVMVKNGTQHIKKNEPLALNLPGTGTSSVTTNAEGYYVGNFTAPSETGSYTIEVNGTPTSSFTVEKFGLKVRTADLNGNPKTSFSPGSKIRMEIISKDENGNSADLDEMSVNVTLPNGTTGSIQDQFTNPSTGRYVNEGDLEDMPSGNYRIDVSGTMDPETQTTGTSFEISGLAYEAMAMNPQFIDQLERGGPVKAFAPGSNITISTFLVNTSEGSMGGGPPETWGLVDMSGKNCSDLITGVSVKDSRGIEYNVNYSAMNISEMAPEGMEPPEGVREQCAVVIQAENNSWTNSIGAYSPKIKMNYEGHKKFARDDFGIQRFRAEGYPADSDGNKNWFQEPNSTTFVKLKVTDLETREQIDAANITSTTIIDMHREFPEHENVFDKSHLNDTYRDDIGAIKFTSPSDEGFYSMKFRFKANGGTQEGIGKAFFDLKEYIIYGEPSGRSWMISSGQDVNLTMNVVDSSSGSYMFGGETTRTPTCTDCDGMTFTVDRLRNDQLNKEIDLEEYGINVSSGTVTNCSNSQARLILSINESNPLPSGWYHMEILSNKSGKTYTGHAGFEIRDFVVETTSIRVNETDDLIASQESQNTYSTDGHVLFAVTGRQTEDWNRISLGQVNLIEVLDSTRRPVSEPYTSDIGKKDVYICEEEHCHKENLFVVNITGLSQGRYQANVNAESDSGASDIGSMWFTVSSYNVIPSYRGMMEHDSVFSSNENFTANFTAYEFPVEAGEPHNLSNNCGDLKFLMKEEADKPIRFTDEYSVNRVEPNKCNLEIDISKLPSAGKYFGEFRVNDTNGVKQTSYIEFNVQDLVVSIPKMQQFWVGQVNKPTKGEPLRVGQQEDFCSYGSPIWENCSDGYCSGNYCVNTSSANREMWRFEGNESCPDDYTQIGVRVNSTHASVSTSGYQQPNLTVGDTFEIPDVKIEDETVTWEITTIADVNNSTDDPSTESDEGYFGFRHANDKICGIQYIDGNGSYFTMTPPSNYSSFYFGHSEVYSREAWDGWLFNLSYDNATVYAYHNTTHLWWNDSTNLNSSGPQGPKAVGEVITDPWGGEWEITSISEDRVSIRGVNTLPQSGAYVNTSFSKSGAFKISKFEEGGQEGDKEGGFDLNGDGDTNDTIYMLLADNNAANVYDTLFISTNRTFSDPIPLDGDRTERSFGGNWTLLNINPEGNMIRAYQNAKWEWSWLGSYRHGSNITVPVMVNKPSGEPIENANVSITKLREGGNLIPIDPLEATTDNKGIAEVKVNLSDLGKPSGRYSFGVKAQNGSSEAALEEWKWPRSVTREFLFDTRIGEGKYVRGFEELPVYRYSYRDNFRVAQLESEAVSGVTDGVFARGHGKNSTECTVNGTSGDTLSEAHFFKDRDVDSRYYYYNNSTGNLYVNRTNGCDFNTSEMTSYQVGDWLDLKSMEGREYNVSFMNVNVSDNDEEVEFGIPGINTSEILCTRNDSGYMYWGYMNNLSFGGETWNVILANASVDYPAAESDEQVKKAWFSQDKNFTDAKGALIGENFTESLYLARVGPDMGRGVIVANFSSTGEKPALGEDITTADNLHPHYKSINESSVGLDLDADGFKNKNFYVVAFDSYQDGKDNFTTIFVDDDMNISNPWLGTDDTKYDFYSNETGMVEQQSVPPVGDTGSLWFESTEDDSEDIKHWNMEVFNRTDMLLFDETWEVGTNQNITIYNKAYGFDQKPISDANVTIDRMAKYTAFGRETLERGEDYTVQSVQGLNVTDEHGASLIKIVPNGTWDQSDYEIEFTIEGSAGTETGNMWFHVGDENE
ncbi:MAG: hypothetical protein ACOC5C_04250 [Halobacteriota archaeon]